MPTRDRAPVGAPCWIDLLTSEPDTTRPFYEELFGWTSESGGEEYGGYVTFSRDGVAVAGCMANDGSSGSPDVWTVYLASDDAEKTCEVAAANGGQVYLPAMDVVDLGHMAVLGDPGGATIGVWQPGRHTGFGVLAEPGAPAWFELHTRDHGPALDFYRNVFGWETHTQGDTDDFRYTTLGEGDDALAGVMDAGAWLPEGEPAQWYVYVAVEDTDATLAKAEGMGAKVVVPAEDTPYGRLAQLADPTGAQFKLVAD